MRFHLYRHFDSKNVLLYVGVSLSTINRLAQHKDNSHWFWKIKKITIEDFPTREAALLAETKAIQEEKPMFNLAKTQQRHPLDEKMDGPDKSSQRLMKCVVFKPMYNVPEAAQCLGLSSRMISKLIEDGKLGSFVIFETSKPKRYISGWQIIDFLEMASWGKLGIARTPRPTYIDQFSVLKGP